MKDIRPIRGKFYISRLIAEGEHETQDFKFQISDALKIARSLSAFANNRGGRLLVGVKDNGAIAGVRSDEDIYMIEQAAEMYCRPALEVRFSAFRATDEGAVVIRAEVDPSPTRPVQAREPDGRWRAYYRVADENIVASPLMVRAWRQADSPTGRLIDLSGSAVRLFDLIDSRGSATVHTLMTSAHISADEAERTIVDLAAAGLIAFRHTPSGFVAVRPEPDDDQPSHT